MGLIVQKFGGTSVADATKIQRAARRAIRAKLDAHQVVMVVSAMGKTTDDLIALAEELTPKPPRREMDMLLTTGEQVSIALMAMAIDAAGHEAISFTGGQVGLITDAAHSRARIQQIDADRIRQHLDAGRIAIVAGFQGITEEGAITTLGRGGSDTTAVALAAVLKADVCEIYTDVDGVYTTDPRVVPEARKIDQIAYDEMLELAALGAGVMHHRAIEFGWKYQVPIHVRSSLTDSPGTMIMPESTGMESVVVRGAALKRDLASVVLVGVPNESGMAARIFARIARHRIVVDDIIQNIYEDGRQANIGFTVAEGDLDEARAVADELVKELKLRGVEIDERVVKVSVVGIGMRSHTGVAARVFGTLAEAGVNIVNISTSEIMVSCVVSQEDGERALKAVHAAFDLDKETGGKI